MSAGKVLIVDDTSFMRLSIRKMLEKNGFEVVAEAEDGQDGLEKYKLHKPDLVTMDITMKRMNGLEALKEIKKMDPAAKIIMVSALGQEEFVRDAIIAGAKNFIVKPFTEESLISTIKKIL